MTIGRQGPFDPSLDRGGFSLRVIACPRCGRPLLMCPDDWGIAQVRLLERSAEARVDEGVTRCWSRWCRVWAGFSFSRKAA